MNIKTLYYRILFSALTYGFVWVIRLAKVVNRKFFMQLAQNDYSFIMMSKEDDTCRHFNFTGGKVLSGRGFTTTDFSLIWRDSQSASNIMIGMISGKRKALYHAVINGMLTLEGEGKYVSLFMETMNQITRIFRIRKKKNSGKSA